MPQPGRAIDSLASDLFARLPAITDDEQRLGVEIYHQLADGEPVPSSRLAEALGLTTREVEGLLGRPNLKCLTYADEQGRIIGFGGLAVQRMSHRFVVDGRTLYTWCAWDSLFLPIVLGRSAEVESPAPGGEVYVRLTVAPDGIQRVEPGSAVMSFLLPSAEAFQADALKVMASFCHLIYFFPDPDAAAGWTAKHPETTVISLPDAFELGRRMTATRWGSALEGRRHGAGPGVR